jgi:serine/threonine protein phosphatase PrpC
MPNCPSCAAETVPEANFCGRCGTRLTAASPEAKCRCGAGPEAIDAAGFCSECGVRQLDAEPGDHEEHIVDANFAAVTDRGRRHAINEDAVVITDAISTNGAARLIVICDGVSSSTGAAQASASAVQAFRTTAIAALARGDELADIALKAAHAAQQAVAAVPHHDDAETAPASTLVAAIVRAQRAVIIWAGDSRAYQLAGTPVQLTRDHSWYNDAVERGALTPMQAKQHKYAHAIVNSLGGTAEDCTFAPSLIELDLPERASLLLCSDGLWNYVDTPEAMARLAAGEAEAIDLCRLLVEFANRQGGHDNISVALLRLNADPAAGLTPDPAG